jgi:hypothetical protein
MSPGLDLLITLLHWGEAGVAHVQSWVWTHLSITFNWGLMLKSACRLA